MEKRGGGQQGVGRGGRGVTKPRSAAAAAAAHLAGKEVPQEGARSGNEVAPQAPHTSPAQVPAIPPPSTWSPRQEQACPPRAATCIHHLCSCCRCQRLAVRVQGASARGAQRSRVHLSARHAQRTRILRRHCCQGMPQPLILVPPKG